LDKLPLINKTKGGIVLKEIMEEVSIESELKIQTDKIFESIKEIYEGFMEKII